MTAMYEMSVPRRDPTQDAALARVREGAGRLEVPVLDWVLAKYDERPCVSRAAVLAIMERAGRH